MRKSRSSSISLALVAAALRRHLGFSFVSQAILPVHPPNDASPQLFLSTLIKTTVIPHGVREVRNHPSLSFSFNCFPSRHP